MSDRSDEEREGWVPVGRRGWKKVGGSRRTEVQPVTPGWAKQLRDSPPRQRHADETESDLPDYRTAKPTRRSRRQP